MKAGWIVAVITVTALPAADRGLSDAEKEQFLRTAEVVSTEELSQGVTNPLRATLEKDGFVHDAHIQDVDDYEPVKQVGGRVQIGFRDFWGFNVVAYRLDRLLGLGMVPVSVKRRFDGADAAFTWWVDDVLLEGKERYLKDIEPPDSDAWNRQMWKVRVFNELAYNTDPNLGNILITPDWRIRLIDFTRAFRIQRNLYNEKNLGRLHRRLFARLRDLDRAVVQQELGDLMSEDELEALLARRDRIVDFFEDEIADKGETAVLYGPAEPQRGHTP